MQRETRRQLKHDEFVDGTMHAIQRVQDNPKPFILGAAALVAVVLLAWAGVAWMSSRAASTADELARGLAALTAPVGDAEGRATAPTPYDPAFATAAERAAAAQDALAKAASGGGMPARVAGYLHGIALLEAGEHAAAAERLQAAARSLRNDPTLGLPARAALATALAGAGRYDEAIEAWSALADEGGDGGADAPYPRELALEGLARAHEAAGDPAAARETYQRIIDLYPDSGSAQRASERLVALAG